MSMIASTTEQHEAPHGGVLMAVLEALMRCWLAYTAWRMEQAAIATLRSMSDQDLNDLGIARSGIMDAVKGWGGHNARA